MLDLTKKKDAHIDERLRGEIMAWLGTTRPDGRPHMVAVWFLWDGEAVYIFSQPNKQKLRNLAVHPYAWLSVDDTKGGGDIVMLEGTVELPTGPDAPSTRMPAYAEKYAGLLARYNWTAESMSNDYSVPIVIRPTKVHGVG